MLFVFGLQVLIVALYGVICWKVGYQAGYENAWSKIHESDRYFDGELEKLRGIVNETLTKRSENG